MIKTTNIDCFLKAEEPLLLDEDHVLQDEEEDDPEWDDVNVEVLKSESKPLLQQLTSDQDTQKNNNNIKAP